MNIYFVLSVCVSKPAFCGSVAVLFIVHTFYEGWNFNSGTYLFTADTK